MPSSPEPTDAGERPSPLGAALEALRGALSEAARGRDFTTEPLTAAAGTVGRVAAASPLQLHELVAAVESLVRETLTAPAQRGAVADAAAVYLCRVARQGYVEGRARQTRPTR